MKQKRRKKPNDRWPGHAKADDAPTKKPASRAKHASVSKTGVAPATREMPASKAGGTAVARVRPAVKPAARAADEVGVRPHRTPRRDDTPSALYVVCAPGLERVTAGELRALELPTGDIEPGGVTLEGNAEAIYKANLHLRSASRIVARVASFRVTTFYDLEARARHIEWERWLGAEPVRVRVTCRKSKLYHSDAVAQRFLEAMAKRTGAWPVSNAPDAGGEGEAEGEDAQLFVVRLHHDTCTVSVDTSGALLHRRGYRQAVAKAPLRETIAASMLLGAGWRGDVPLVDPLCGAGTIPIEGAMIARRIAPGAARPFAFMRWPSYDADLWARLLAAARAGELPNARVPIVGSDRDAGAIEAATANAARAGVGADVSFVQHSLSASEAPAGRGWVVTNPPYGVRVGAADSVRDLYAQLGNVARAVFPGWGIGFLSPDRSLDTQPRIAVTPAFETTNGGIKVRFMTGRVPGA
jgi:putative N6-adenine-specific DNA methylase